jgi:type I restriction enzyme S subunit
MSSEWANGKLGEFIELKRGYDLPQAKRTLGGVPLVSSSGVSDRHDVAMVKGPGVVTGRYGTIGQVFYVEEDFWPLNTTLYVRDFKGNHRKFINYFLKTLDFHAYSDKAAVPGVNRNHLHEALVTIPPVSAQVKIAEFLGALDDRITLLRETNTTLEAIAQAMFKSWFVDFDPVHAKMQGLAPEGMDEATAALFPDSFEESELGPVPKGWEVMPVGDAVETLGGATPDTKTPAFWEPAEHHWTTPKDLSEIASPVLLSTERKLSGAGIKKISSGLLPVGTLLMSSRAPIGYLALAQVPMAINQGYIAIPPGGKLSPLHMLFWCQTNMDIIKGRANGSTFMEISKKAFRPIPALVPTQPVRDAFDVLTAALFARLIENEKQAQTLAALRDTLLPRLISGQLRIEEAEEVLA